MLNYKLCLSHWVRHFEAWNFQATIKKSPYFINNKEKILGVWWRIAKIRFHQVFNSIKGSKENLCLVIQEIIVEVIVKVETMSK